MAGGKKNLPHFKTTNRTSVPTGRHGKHNTIVYRILNDLEGLAAESALKIPLSELPDTKVNIRSALNRATRKLNRNVATAADDQFLFVRNT